MKEPCCSFDQTGVRASIAWLSYAGELIDALQQCQRILAAINDGEPCGKVVSIVANCKTSVTKLLGESPKATVTYASVPQSARLEFARDACSVPAYNAWPSPSVAYVATVR